MLKLKQDFLDKKLWKGKLPDIFEQYVSYIFDLDFKEEVQPADLLEILMKMDHPLDEYDWNFVEDFENFDKSLELLNPHVPSQYGPPCGQWTQTKVNGQDCLL